MDIKKLGEKRKQFKKKLDDIQIQSTNQEGDIDVLQKKLRDEVNQLNQINRNIQKYSDDIQNIEKITERDFFFAKQINKQS